MLRSFMMQKMGRGLDSQTRKNIEKWLDDPAYDAKTKAEIKRLEQTHPDELVDAFYTHLEFGTGGLRGLMGVGTNRMNVYTVRAATQGLANYLLKQPEKEKSVLIGFDCRNHSEEFAKEAASVLSANGIKVYLYKELRPVALVSFGLLYKKCTAGIMITASHNPPAYNGYKVYWSYGGQVLPPHDKAIVEEVEKIKSPSQVKWLALPNKLVEMVGEEIDHAYLETIDKLQLHREDNQAKGKDLHVVYSSLHGGGITMVPPALKEWGFTNLTLVKEQEKPDGNFPTVKVPNPEEPDALKLGVETLQQVNGDLLLATDPDVDRIAVVVNDRGKMAYLTGNQVACLCLAHVLKTYQHAHTMPPKPVCVKTIVTSELFKAIAHNYDVQCLDVLTGFKYIGQKIAEWEKEGVEGIPMHHYLFGGEESYGYLLGTHARDKDAVISACLICDMALQLKLQGKTLIDFLYEIYHKYGVYRETLKSFTYEGKEGLEKISKMMEHLRKNPPKAIGGSEVVAIEDYLTHTVYYPETGKKEALHLPKSDVLRFWLADQTKLVVRPSGTEPKIKVYGGAVERHYLTTRAEIDKAIQSTDEKLAYALKALERLLS